jgi:hypothetical protein
VGYGSSLNDLKPVDDPDSYLYEIDWYPGPSLYMYIASFILSFFGFMFYNKMRRLKRYEKEASGEEEVAVVEVDDEEEAVVAVVEEVEERPKSKRKSKRSKEDESLEEEAEFLEEEAESLEVEPELPKGEAESTEVMTDSPEEAVESAPDEMQIQPAPTPKEKEQEEEFAETSREVSTPSTKTEPGEVKIIELGPDDFQGGVKTEDELRIDGVDEATLECPGCGERFKAPLGGRIKCPYCGLEGDVD